MSVEIPNTFAEIIPWDYSSSKIDTDATYLCTITEEAKLGFSITSRKSWLTQAVNRVTKDETFAKTFKLKGTQTQNRYKDTLHFLEERMAMLVNAYRRRLQLFPLLHTETLTDFDKHYDTYWKCRDIIDQLIANANPTLSAPAPKAVDL